MNHITTLQAEFLKEARKWTDLTLKQQHEYLRRHPKSKRRLTTGRKPKDLPVSSDEKREKMMTVHKEMLEKFVSDAFKHLKGKKVSAFGKGSRGLWGDSISAVTYKIKKVKLEDSKALDYESIDELKNARSVDVKIYLDGYKASKNGLIYTDSNFKRSINKLMEEGEFGSKALDYTEQGMQGNNYASMELKLPRIPNIYYLAKKVKEEE